MKEENNKEDLENIKPLENIQKKEENVLSSDATIEEKIGKEENIEKEKRQKNKGKMIVYIILRILVILIILAGILFVFKTSKYYVNNDIKDKTNLIINNNNVTSRLKEDLIIEDNIIYLSMKDVSNFLDNYVYEEKETNQVITRSSEKIAAINFTNKTMVVNGSNMISNATAIKRNEQIYLPISELTDIYNIEIANNESTGIVTIDSLDKEQEKASAEKNISVKSYAKVLSRTVDKIKQGDQVIVIAQLKNGWTKVRTENGKIGYVQTKKISESIKIREDEVQTSQITEKINMFWDYYSEYAQAPDRTGEKIDGVNVVSPTFFYIGDDGNLVDHVGTAGENYIQWAKNNGYKIWPMISNSEAGIKVTSTILNSYNNRQNLIEDIVNMCVKYKFDGINIDFEFMYETDKDMYSRLIIELAPRLKEMGVVLSLDLTAPDGSPNWSLCYDRYVLGRIADYLVFMAYDQYGTSSTSAGTTAGYDWIELALNKFITTYEVDSNKIILGMPFYTRIWTEAIDGSVSSKVVNMKSIETVIPDDAEKIWLDDVKQNYVEYKSGATTKKIWIEDEQSIAAKVSLVSKYNLAGVSCWEKDRELDSIWEVIKEGLEK